MFFENRKSLNRRLRGFRRYSQIAGSTSTNAVSFSSARTTKRFPSPRCASAIQIVRQRNKEMLTGNENPDSIRPHENKTTRLILALCFFGVALCFADDPQMSTSKPNESKSKVTTGTEKIKPTYISLVQFTDKGIQGAKQTTQRVAAWAAKVQSMG